MPSKFIVRDFAANSYYHVCNSGFLNNHIFVDEKDYLFFKTYLFIYTRPLSEVLAIHPDLPARLKSKTLSGQVDLVGYSLAPSHFHLLLKQNSPSSISQLMKQMANAYTPFFNQKHHKIGPLFAGRFKAVKISDSKLLTPILKYIHNEPTNHSSFNDYLGQPTILPCSQTEKEKILAQFPSLTKFNDYHRNQMDSIRMAEKIQPFIIEKNRSNP